jgi:elongation factor 3
MWPKPHLLILDEPTNYLDRESLGALATAIKEFRGGVCLISHDAQFVSSLANEEWHIEAGRMIKKGVNGALLAAPVDSQPGSSAVSSAQSSAVNSAVNSDAEDTGDMQFKQRKSKKKKFTRAQLKEREVRRRLRYLEWLNSPKGTPKPVDTDDEAD